MTIYLLILLFLLGFISIYFINFIPVLASTNWKLKDSQSYITFIDSNRFKASVGCNTILGTYKLYDNNLELNIGPMTRMRCGPDINNKEREYINILNNVTNYELNKNMLLLKNKNSVLLTYYKN